MLYKTHFRIGEDCTDIETALSLSRKIPTGIPRTIEITGKITLTAPIILDSRDSGITLTGGIISGGITLDEWEHDPTDTRFVRAKLPNGISPRTLIIGGSMKKLSVYPQDTMLECLDKPENLYWRGSVNGGWNRELTEYEMHHMHIKPEDVPPGFLPGSTEVKLYHSWDESTVPVLSYDSDKGEITFESELGHPAGTFGKYNYQFLNLRDGMNAPGTWYADLENKWIYYYPTADDNTPLIGIVPTAETLIRINNGENITVSDTELSFCGAKRVTSGLRSVNLNGAVEVRNSKNVTLNDLHIHDCSGHGIKEMNCKDSKIGCCEISSMGAGGIFTHNCENEEICFNDIRDIGLSAFSSIGIHAGGRSMLVWVLDGKPVERGLTILRSNKITGAPYCGITCNGGPHIIENNTILDFMTKLDDGGAIYVSRGDRVIMCGNKAVGSYNGNRKKAYYFDEGGHDCLFERNESYGIKTAYGDHLCERMTVRQNHFECKEHIRFSFCLCKEYDIYDNVFATDKGMEIELELLNKQPVEKMREYLDEHIHFKNNIIISPSNVFEVSCNGEQFCYPFEKGEADA